MSTPVVPFIICTAAASIEIFLRETTGSRLSHHIITCLSPATCSSDSNFLSRIATHLGQPGARTGVSYCLNLYTWPSLGLLVHSPLAKIDRIRPEIGLFSDRTVQPVAAVAVWPQQLARVSSGSMQPKNHDSKIVSCSSCGQAQRPNVE